MQFNRRKFIKTLVVTASAVMTSNLIGCNNSADEVDVEVLPVEPSTIVGSQFFPQSVVSGDPKPDSVILWTRIEDVADADLALTLQVSLDESFNQLIVEQEFTALASADHCLKIRVTELNASQYYYYRFVYQKDGTNYLSKNGRTKTAPSVDSDVKVKFAYVSCQDYIGRYYNTYLSVLDNDDLDFVVHLGDYIYETTGDPLFQESTDDRSITFNDSENVLTIGVGEKTTQAANSLDNYRQLYKEYRSDELLQKVHERFPMIAIWDDHEFSDDSWSDRATYLDGVADEQQTQRKKNSEMAYFEFMPIDHEQPHTQGELAAGEMTIDDSYLYPNTRIYRDFHFGQHLHLAMTDFRTNRPDHILPEDAFPAAVEMSQATLTSFLFVMDESEAFTKGRARAVAAIKGNLATSYLNQVLVQAKASLPSEHVIQQLPALPEQGVEQGLAFYTMGKTSLFNYLGSRYFVVKETYDLYAGYKEFIAQQQGSSVQGGFDDQQTAWLVETFATSTSTWKVLASSVSFSPLMFDFSASRADSNIIPLEYVLGSELIPAALKQRFYLEADQWDGFPQYKENFVNNVMSQYGVISLGGDVHSSYITEHKANDVTGLRSFNFTTSSISSGTFGSFLEKGMNDILGQLGDVPPEVQQLPLFFDSLVKTATQRDDISDDLVFSRMAEHGVVIVEVDANEMLVDFHNIPDKVDGIETAKQNYYQSTAEYFDKVRLYQFKVADGQLLRLA